MMNSECGGEMEGLHDIHKQSISFICMTPLPHCVPALVLSGSCAAAPEPSDWTPETHGPRLAAPSPG